MPPRFLVATQLLYSSPCCIKRKRRIKMARGWNRKIFLLNSECFQLCCPALAWFISTWLPVAQLWHLCMERFHRKSSFHTFSLVTYSHTQPPLPPPLIARWHKSTTLTRLFAEGRLIKDGHSDIAVKVALNWISTIHLLLHTSSSPLLCSYPSIYTPTKSVSLGFNL